MEKLYGLAPAMVRQSPHGSIIFPESEGSILHEAFVLWVVNKCFLEKCLYCSNTIMKYGVKRSLYNRRFQSLQQAQIYCNSARGRRDCAKFLNVSKHFPAWDLVLLNISCDDLNASHLGKSWGKSSISQRP